MQSQKPSWRKARSSPSAASRPAARARARCPPPGSRARPGSKQKKPPLIQCSLRGFSTKPRDPVPSSSSATPHCRFGRTTVIVASAPSCGGRRAGPEIDVGDAVGVGGAEASAAEALPQRAIRPPVGVSRPVSTHSTSTPSGQRSPRTNSADRLAEVAGGEQEAIEALRGVDPDHVPEDRLPADLDQRLRHRLRPLPQPRPAPAAEDDDGRPHRMDS